jgi:hypothetical protein
MGWQYFYEMHECLFESWRNDGLLGVVLGVRHYQYLIHKKRNPTFSLPKSNMRAHPKSKNKSLTNYYTLPLLIWDMVLHPSSP